MSDCLLHCFRDNIFDSQNVKKYKETFTDRAFVEINNVFMPEAEKYLGKSFDLLEEVNAFQPCIMLHKAIVTPNDVLKCIEKEKGNDNPNTDSISKRNKISNYVYRKYINIPNLLCFSYQWTLPEPHFENCGCVVCILKTLITTTKFIDFVKEITGETEELNLLHSFAAIYKDGDFLGIHTDETSPRKYAFVFNFTDNWHPMFGGHLHFIDGKNGNIEDVINVVTNSLVLFKVSKNSHHMVSHITCPPDLKRKTFSGWFG